MSENKKYGYTGKGLRVDLTTGKITVEPTFPRFDGYIGGTAFGYKVFWDEVPPETDCYAPENKLVIAPGPLSGTGAIWEALQKYPEQLFAQKFSLYNRQKFSGRKIKEGF